MSTAIHAALVAVFRGPNILMLKRRPDDRNYIGWGLPGGAKEPEDPSLQQTAVRELMEETGLDWHSPVFRYRVWTTHAKKDAPLRINVYSVESPEGEVVLSDEHTEYKWLTVEEALQLEPLAGSVTENILKFFSKVA